MRILLLLAVLLAAPAHAQITYAPTANGTYTVLDGATVTGPINVRLQGCPAGPWTYAVDGVQRNVEQTCPFDLGGDNFMLVLAAGAHTITATGSTTHTASFTVSGPQPPTDPAYTGDMLLSWAPPTKNADGSTLTDLAGFWIYYGTSPALGQSLGLPNPALTSYRFEDLAAGTWHFAMTARNAAGVESDRTASVSFAITAPPAPSCTAPKPDVETRPGQCVAPAVGTWEQTLTYASAAYPTCWAPGEWLPASAPSGACVVPPPPVEAWKVAPISGTRPVYEPVANLSSTAMVRGTSQGRVDPGKPCGEEVFKSGRNSYRYVDERDVVLDSPTYKGREHVAICTR